jgi:hypothetical protein
MSTANQEAARPPVEKLWYYICDHCGNLVTIEAAPIPEDQEWACDECEGSALWEFTNQAHAMQHARHIQAAVRTGLFRETRA